MQRKGRLTAFVLVIFCFWLFPSLSPGAGSASENYSIPTTVFSGGGLPMESGNFKTNGTIGQPSPLMGEVEPSSESYVNYPGFWYTLEAVLECGDLGSFAATFGLTDSEGGYNPGCDSEPDGDVDGVDLAGYADSY